MCNTDIHEHFAQGGLKICPVCGNSLKSSNKEMPIDFVGRVINPIDYTKLPIHTSDILNDKKLSWRYTHRCLPGNWKNKPISTWLDLVEELNRLMGLIQLDELPFHFTESEVKKVTPSKTVLTPLSKWVRHGILIKSGTDYRGSLDIEVPCENYTITKPHKVNTYCINPNYHVLILDIITKFHRSVYDILEIAKNSYHCAQQNVERFEELFK